MTHKDNMPLASDATCQKAMMAQRSGALSLLTATLTLAALSVGTAHAQSIVGAWQTTGAQTPNTPGYVRTVTYTPNGRYTEQLVVGSLPGRNGGIFQTNGSYRVSGDGAVTVTFEDSAMCLPDGSCQPAPPQMVPPFGSTSTYAVQFQGNNQLTTIRGEVYLRVQ